MPPIASPAVILLGLRPVPKKSRTYGQYSKKILQVMEGESADRSIGIDPVRVEMPAGELWPPGRTITFWKINSDDGIHFTRTSDYEGSQGRYGVIFTFGKPGVNRASEDLLFVEALLTQGDSHITVTDKEPGPRGATKVAKYHIFSNDGGHRAAGYHNSQDRLDQIEFVDLQANSISEAEETARTALLPQLDYCSLYMDTPLHVRQVDIVEYATGNTKIVVKCPAHNRNINRLPLGRLNDKEFKLYIRYYRDALNSNSNKFIFLCFYKIIEGILKRRKKLGSEAAKAGRSFSRASERVPEDWEDKVAILEQTFSLPKDWGEETVNVVFPPEVQGDKINKVIQRQLSPLRNSVAHAYLDKESPTESDLDEIDERLNHWLPFTRLVVRRLLREEFPSEYPDIRLGYNKNVADILGKEWPN